MGSDEGQDDESPVHRVWVDAFDLAVYPVTQAQYAQFLEETSHDVPREWAPAAGEADLPVVGVSWHDAQAYCTWASRIESETPAHRSRMGAGGARRRRRGALPLGRRIPAWIPDGGRGPLEAPWPVTVGDTELVRPVRHRRQHP